MKINRRNQAKNKVCVAGGEIIGMHFSNTFFSEAHILIIRLALFKWDITAFYLVVTELTLCLSQNYK